jgi:hypothetical protein
MQDFRRQHGFKIRLGLYLTLPRQPIRSRSCPRVSFLVNRFSKTLTPDPNPEAMLYNHTRPWRCPRTI